MVLIAAARILQHYIKYSVHHPTALYLDFARKPQIANMKQTFVKKPATNYKRIFGLFLALGLITLTNQGAQAKEYKIEALIFKNLNGSRASESHHYQPPKSVESEAQTWLVKPSMLLKEAQALKQSPDYQLLHYYSWGQEVLPSSQAAVYNLIETELSGWIKVYARTLLFANLDIDLDGYRMTENRRLKLDEEHYFDHPKFGVILRVSRLLPNEKDDQGTESNPE